MSVSNISDSIKYQWHLSEITHAIEFYWVLSLTPIGFIGNLLIILVYSSAQLRKHSTSFYYCLNALADLIYLCVNLSDYLQWKYFSSTFTTFICRFYFTSTYSFDTISSYMSVMAAIDRLRFIVFPMKFEYMQKLRFQLTTALTIFILMICVYIPFGYYKILKEFSCDMNTAISYNIFGWFYLVLAALTPTIVILVCSIKLLTSIKESKRKTCQNFANKKNLATNILALNLLFTILNIFYSINLIITTTLDVFYPEFSKNYFGKISISNNFFSALRFLNFVSRIFVHLLTNKLFLNKTKRYFKFIFHLNNSVLPLSISGNHTANNSKF